MNKKNEERNLIVYIGNKLHEAATNNEKPIDRRAIAYIDVYKMLPSSDQNSDRIPLNKIRYVGYLLGEISSYTYRNYGIFLSSLVCRKDQSYFPGDGYFQMLKENNSTMYIPQKEDKTGRKNLVEKHQKEAIEYCKNNSELFKNYPNKS